MRIGTQPVRKTTVARLKLSRSRTCSRFTSCGQGGMCNSGTLRRFVMASTKKKQTAFSARQQYRGVNEQNRSTSDASQASFQPTT